MGIRQERIQEQLIHELSDMILRDLRDPRLGFVTLTGAEITRDLRHAKVYVSVMGEPDAQAQSIKALNSASGLMRGEFARRAHLRVAPELVFEHDTGIERGQRIFDLLHTVEDDLKPRLEEDAVTVGADGGQEKP
jgi:ribosome-binding factor A